MKKILTLLLVSMLISTGLFAQKSNRSAQTGWQMQSVQIQTRWAKEVTPANTLKEYPRPQMVRPQWQNLNGLWSYAITAKDAKVPVKYDGRILVPYPLESALSGVKGSLQPEQNLWYKRSFNKPVLKSGERALLHFGAVDWQATVFLNGKRLGEHSGGYTAFDFDITNALKPGLNQLTLKVFDPTDKGIGPHGKQVLAPGGIMYTPSSGIWQTVWLEEVPAASISNIKQTPDVDKGLLNMTVTAPEGYTVIATASAGGQTVGRAEGKSNTNIELPLQGAGGLRLWSPDDPFLYDLTVQLSKNGKVIDQVKSYFGMRKIEVKKDDKGIERIFLNGKYTYNLGTLDQGFWPDGLYTAPTDDALKFDIQAIKAMGFNTIRKHIKIEPARWYYWADKLGMLVWQDMVNPANTTKECQDEFEKESKETIAQLYNHPSITTWVVFNEGWAAYDQGRVTQMVKDADPSRIVDGHTGENYFRGSPKDVNKKWENSDLTDIHAYPPPSIPPYLTGKARVLGEFGGIGVPIERHVWDDFAAGWGYGKTVGPKTMIVQYTAMTDTLKALEAQGLSGSIYTQPFDVETEQNGLMTYDRELIKMPLATMREINSRVWPITANYENATAGFSAKTAPQETKDYLTRLDEYNKGNRDHNFLYYLAFMADAAKDKAHAVKVSNDYIKQLNDPFTPDNLKFIKKFTQSVNSKGFEILYKNEDRADQVLGKEAAELTLFAAIQADEINTQIPKDKKIKPDWTAIEKSVSKYGDLGTETLLFYQVLYSLQYNDLPLFKSIWQEWLSKYGSKRKYMTADGLNNWAWNIFQGSANDPEMLKAALAFSACSLTKGTAPYNMDTYANILYKLGRKAEAITWEQKAAKMDPNSQEFQDTLAKMQKGE